MKINGSKPPGSRGPEKPVQNVKKVTATDAAGKSVPAAPTGPSSGDTVELSGTSREVAVLVAAINQLPEIREQKVQEVKQAVDNGTYKVDPQKVAEKILKEI